MAYNEQIILRLFRYINNSFKLEAMIDDFEEISFSDNMFESGDFTITINYNIPNALKFEREMFVQFGDYEYRFGEILTISDSIGEDGKGSQVRIITGKDARYIFKRRVIKNLNNEENWAMTAKGEICLRELIKAQCGAGAETKRQLPIINIIPEVSDAIGEEYSVSESFSNLYDVLTTIATQSKIGWRIKFSNNEMTLECYPGTDRSETVQFSTDFDSLSNGTFKDSSESYANSIYIGGKGTGSDRDIYEGEQEISGNSPSGLERYEAYDNQSSMTSESEYESEALSMLSQYGQTLELNGRGLAKSPYIYRQQYFVGDSITVAFSGKKAKVQILSVTENWSGRGSYGIEFSFGKPQNDLSRQLQLILKQIQKASNKTSTTSSVKYYTLPTDTSQPKADVIYDTIGFQGDVGNGATFTLYYDSEKTGAKNYHIWFKQLAGTGKLTLTTGVAGASNLVLNAGTYVAIIYVDANGNVLSQGATATNTIEEGNTQPATSGGVAGAISNALAVPNDSILHYSFDELANVPDGSYVYKRNKDWTSVDWTRDNTNFTQSIENSRLKWVWNTTGGTFQVNSYKSNLPNKFMLVKLNAKLSVEGNTYFRLLLSLSGTLQRISNVPIHNGNNEFVIAIPSTVNSTYTIVQITDVKQNDEVLFEYWYIGDGSNSVPVIDNSGNGYNAANNGIVRTEGISGKGGLFFKGTAETIFNFSKNFSISFWIKAGNTSNNLINYILNMANVLAIKNGDTNKNYVSMILYDDSGNIILNDDVNICALFSATEFSHFAIVKNGTEIKFFLNGENVKTQTLSTEKINLTQNNLLIGDSSNTRTSTIDDLNIYSRALTNDEIKALYLNCGQVEKFYTKSDYVNQ